MDPKELDRMNNELVSDLTGEDIRLAKKPRATHPITCRYCDKWSYYESLVRAHEDYDHEW